MLKKVANAAAGRLDTETYSVSTLRGPNAREQSWQPFSACWQKKRPLLKKAKDVIVLHSTSSSKLCRDAIVSQNREVVVAFRS
jgi:hypothetical protein